MYSWIEAMRYKIKNWREYQHYKGRRPPWIKVHKQILTSKDWVMLPDASKLLLFVCMMAAQMDKDGDGGFDGDPKYLMKIACLDSEPCLEPLVSSGFLLIPINASATLAKCEQSVLSSVSVSVSVSESSSEGGVGETSKAEDFVGPPSKPMSVFPDPLADFEPETAAKAREVWSLFALEHHGSCMRNLHLESTHKELRHFAKAIAAFKQQAIDKLDEYYTSPPKEDKALAAFQIIQKLGLQVVIKTPAPWEKPKQMTPEEVGQRFVERHKLINSIGRMPAQDEQLTL